MLLVRAWDDSDDARWLFRVDIGDVLEWKKTGITGLQCGRVAAIDDAAPAPDHDRYRPIQLEPLNRYTRAPIAGAKRTRIGLHSVMRVFGADGVTRKLARREDQLADQS